MVFLALAPAVALGLARFAYALVLPDMRADLGWSYAEAGWMNGINAIGYLLGAMGASLAISRIGAWTTITCGCAVCVAGLALCAVTRDFGFLSAARFLAGAGGAFAFAAGGFLAAAIAQPHGQRGAFLLGLFYAGPGLGILLSGISVPATLAAAGSAFWPLAWAILAALAALFTVGLWQVRAVSDGARSADHRRARLRPMWRLLAGYLAFGCGYIAYMTFMIAWVRDLGGSATFQGLFWSVIGLGVMVSPWLWSGRIGALDGGRTFSVLSGIMMIGAVLPLLNDASAVLLLSAALFGCSFFGVVGSTTAFIRRNLPRAAWASGIGAMTVAFSLGQIIGPVGTGLITDLVGGLSSGLWISAALIGLGACLAAFQPSLPAEG
jgi:predicted MFS family arabinose efflux permease